MNCLIKKCFFLNSFLIVNSYNGEEDKHNESLVPLIVRLLFLFCLFIFNSDNFIIYYCNWKHNSIR